MVVITTVTIMDIIMVMDITFILILIAGDKDSHLADMEDMVDMAAGLVQDTEQDMAADTVREIGDNGKVLLAKKIEKKEAMNAINTLLPFRYLFIRLFILTNSYIRIDKDSYRM